MGTLGAVAMDVLGAFVGPTAASTCVRATALSMGKTADDLDKSDLPALEQSIRRLLSPIAPASVVSQVLADIEGRLQ
jgi:hypothetical protein